MSHTSFEEFLNKVHVSPEVGEKLKAGKICSARELACSETSKICELVDDCVLNVILPVLQKHKYKLVLSNDPNGQALKYVSRLAGGDTKGKASSNQTASDAMPYMDDPSEQQRSQRPSTVRKEERHKVAGGRMERSRGGGDHYGNTINVDISGGIVNQPNIGGKTTIVNRNKFTSITIFTDSKEDRARLRSQKLDATSFNVKGVNVSSSELQFAGERDYWLNDVDVKPTSDQEYEKHKTDDTVYQMVSRKSGRALIINNIKFGGNAPRRDGAEVDTKKLKELLQYLGCEVQVHENKKKAEIEQILHEFTAASKNKTCSVSVVFIGSHGARDNNKDFFVGVDQGRVYVDDVISRFTASKCPNLEKKPKLFFLQFCRADDCRQATSNPTGDQQSSTVTQSAATAGGDSVVPKIPHDEADMMLSYATTAGLKGYRDTGYGSWYVTALCKIFKENAKSEDVLSMMTMVNKAVMAEQGKDDGKIVVQMSQLDSKLQKKVKFFP